MVSEIVRFQESMDKFLQSPPLAAEDVAAASQPHDLSRMIHFKRQNQNAPPSVAIEVLGFPQQTKRSSSYCNASPLYGRVLSLL